MMKHYISKKKQEMVEKGHQPQGLPQINLILVDDMELAISDNHVEDFVDDYVKEVNEIRNQTDKEHFDLKITNMLIFDFLRIKLKEGLLTDITLTYNGAKYDVVLPNGKRTNDSLPEKEVNEIFLHMKFLMDLL